MTVVPLLLQVAALVSEVLAAFALFPNSKVAWGWLGLALWFLSLMIGAVPLHQAQ
jgi:hypothetical protein